MMNLSLKKRILISFLAVIAVIGMPVALLGHYVVEKDIINKVQQEVRKNLAAARFFYNEEIERIGERMRIVEVDGDLEKLRAKLNLDYLLAVDGEKAAQADSEIVRAAVAKKTGAGGSRVISHAELLRISPRLAEQATIPIKPTQMARPTNMKVLEDGLAKEYALPLFDKTGKVVRVIYGGRIVNKDYTLVDRIRALVFGDELYDTKPVGTVTIFLDDTRVATNVIAHDGNRAVGTRVSAKVYETVVEKGQVYDDRAFVVMDWYKTAYEPIKSIDGRIIGILYVGILEKPYADMARNIALMALVIIAGAAVSAIILAVILAGVISRPLTHLSGATKKLSNGELAHRVPVERGAAEFTNLAESFNEMCGQIEERDRSLSAANEKLGALNKSYLDLIGFVSHELKGILSSTMLNAYSVRDGFLGMINFKQRKAMDSITRNLDHLAATVQKFLSLSRIEKGELDFHPGNIGLKNDVFAAGIEALSRSAIEKQMTLTNNIDAELTIKGDADLLQIVANNLVGNAIKYGTVKGTVVISCTACDGKVKVEVYNDGVPITAEQQEKLFRKFSRLDTPETRRAKGTGLGLFITKEIIDKHGGRIWVEPREHGNAFIFEVERGL
jgi:two-component system, NtrC family, sensor kinase